MITLLNRRAQTEIINKIITSHNRIYPTPGVCRYNFQCHSNAVHDAYQDGDEHVAMVIYIDDAEPIIHFINVKSIEGKTSYVDNTLGIWCTQYEFYLIKLIPKDDFFKVHSLFHIYRKELRKSLSFWTRLLSDQEF